MSAFMVSPECMQLCVTAMYTDKTTPAQADELGVALYAMNKRAVVARYGESDILPGLIDQDYDAWTWARSGAYMLLTEYGKFTKFGNVCRLLKALHCFLYQCSEGEVHKEPLFLRIVALVNALQRRVVESLPEYDAAPWDN